MELIKLTFVEHGGLKDQYISPHMMDLRKSRVDAFANDTEQGLRLSPVSLAKSAAGIFTPDTTRERKITAQIDGGWDSKRIMFAMVVRTSNREHSKDYSYIIGSTDHSGYTERGKSIKFDPRMKMYFNSITRIHMNESSYRGKDVWQPKLQSHDQILNMSTLTGFGSNNRGTFNDRPVSLRPTDLFRRSSGASSFGSMLQNKDVSNLCGAFTGQLKASSRNNNSTSLYLSRTLSAYMSSAADPSVAHLHDIDDGETLRAAHDQVDENVLEKDPWMMDLSRDTGIFNSGYITYEELMMMSPDFDEDRQLPFIPLDKRRQMEFDNQAGWRGDDNETVAAKIISQSLPGLMINSMYSTVSGLVLDSRARSGEFKVLCAKISPFVEGMSVRSSWPYFESMAEHVLLNECTRGGVFDIQAHIDANIDQEIHIRIRVDGGEEAYFVFPAFMDASVAPTLENDTKAFDLLSKGVVDLAAELSSRRQRAQPSHVDAPNIVLSSERHERSERSREETSSIIGTRDW